MLWDTSADDLVFGGAAGIDLAGDIDVDGTANLDAVDIDGAVQIDNTVTVGENDTGYDVKFFGATSGAYMLWDESTDDLILAGASKLYLYDAGGEYLSSSGSALTIASGSAAWELPAADGSANQYLKTDGSGNLDWATAGGGDMSDLVDDTTPQLGGDLDLNGNNIDFPSTANISDCLDEDDMASDSATKLATQQSIKAYADSVGFDVSTITGATELAAIPADTDEFIISDAGVLKRVDYSYLKPPAFYYRAYQSSQQTISNNTLTVLSFDVASDAHSMWDTSTNTLTIPAGGDGLWLLYAKVMQETDTSTGHMQLRLYTGAEIQTYAIGMLTGNGVGSGLGTVQLTARSNLVAGNTFQWKVYQSSGGNLNILNHATATVCFAMRLGDG
jgi:hypothetical protein